MVQNRVTHLVDNKIFLESILELYPGEAAYYDQYDNICKIVYITERNVPTESVQTGRIHRYNRLTLTAQSYEFDVGINIQYKAFKRFVGVVRL